MLKIISNSLSLIILPDFSFTRLLHALLAHCLFACDVLRGSFSIGLMQIVPFLRSDCDQLPPFDPFAFHSVSFRLHFAPAWAHRFDSLDQLENINEINQN